MTLSKYLDTGATAALQLLVLIAGLGLLGVETTSFAALLAAAGIAIGARGPAFCRTSPRASSC